MRNDEHAGRRSIRLPEYDYTKEGAYSITICTAGRRHLFGDVGVERMRLNDLGHMAESCWLEIPLHCRRVLLDYFVIMPNHVHGILCITGTQSSKDDDLDHSAVGAQHAAPSADKVRVPRVVPHSVGAIVRNYKSAVTRMIHSLIGHGQFEVWHRNYHEHVIRDKNDLFVKRRYIQNNPLQWESDEYYCK